MTIVWEYFFNEQSNSASIIDMVTDIIRETASVLKCYHASAFSEYIKKSSVANNMSFCC